MEIIHVQQKTDTECVIACIAMVTKVPYTEILSIYDKPTHEGLTLHDELRILDHLNVPHILYSPLSQMYEDRLYMVSVPSPTKPLTQGHRVVVDTSTFIPTVHDPLKGRTQYYSNHDQGSLPLFVYFNVMEILC